MTRLNWNHCAVPGVECKRSQSGFGYFGKKQVTWDNEKCQAWTDISDINPIFTTERIEDSHNFCRTVREGFDMKPVFNEPWCFSNVTRTAKKCNVEYCGKFTHKAI